ncbi:MAG TPA: hypothetical protein VK892_02010, partial [Pyrinomonadaceae bacterium]|nr:hypothetical protein [Pyrinomonadaceae bacterium]
EAKARRAKARRAKARNQLKTQLQNADRLKKFIETIEFATWRGELARAVLKIANEPSQREEIFGFGFKGKESIPPMSQIGSLRSTVGKLKKVEIDNDSESVVTNWLKHLEETSNRLKKWGDNENSAKANLKKIKHLVQSKTLVWQKLKDFWQEPETLTTDENSLKENLWTEAVKSLFDACARAHKRDLERKQEKQEDENNG